MINQHFNHRLFSLFIGCLLVVACETKMEDDVLISASNPSQVDVSEKPVRIPKGKLGISVKKGMQPLLMDKRSSDTIPSQLVDTDGDGEWDELFFLLDLDRGASKEISLNWKTEALEWQERTYVRFGVRPSESDTVRPAKKDTFYPKELPGVMGYQPYQTDGPSWENDKVGFRHYLDGRNSKDVFGKKVSTMSPRNVGINAAGVTEDNYHVMEVWGRDILSVGTSVGIGGYSLLIDDQAVRLGVTQRDSANNVAETTFEVVESGPLVSLMKYAYQDWTPEETGRTYQVTETTQIWPGMYGYHNSVVFNNLQGDETGVIGLVNIHTDKMLQTFKKGDFTVLYTHDKQTYDKEWYLGLALIIPNTIYEGWTEAPQRGQLTDSFLAKVKIEEGMPLEYYAVAAWELADPGFSQEEYFREYLEELTGELGVNLKIDIIQNPQVDN
ncbi:DUF4861 domain-containing protein [Echinicola strongylocentroti]|uniref:DUF4861 domain-containing protein n=1 Tax=Echinicola strongylocentroti TaxID=1795355 RepID=A0A2Z4ID29_9BACT|nr:DUF4861 domain-containing protein [Echinicola strongylocentroti]AWW28749.1 DUF4861 domain-containing protein [Echinicola strongylocentroti]